MFNAFLQLTRFELFQLVACLWHADITKPCVLELEAFGVLVQLTYLMPSALADIFHKISFGVDTSSSSVKISGRPPIGSSLDHHNLRLIYTLHVFQFIVSIENMMEFVCSEDCDCPAQSSDQISPTMDFSQKGNLIKLLFCLWVQPLTQELIGFDSMEAHLDIDKLWQTISQKM